MRQIFDRDTERGESIADIVRTLPAKRLLTRTGKQVPDRSTVWAMLRNPARRGQAAFGKTQTTGRRAKPSHPVATAVSATAAARPDAMSRPSSGPDPGPRAIAEETFEPAQARLRENKHYAKRNSREPALLKASSSVATAATRAGAHRRAPPSAGSTPTAASARTTAATSRVSTRPIRADELDAVVWAEVEQLPSDPH